MRHLADLTDHLALRQREVARAALPVVERPLAQLRVIRAPLAHHRQGFGEILFVERNDRDWHRPQAALAAGGTGFRRMPASPKSSKPAKPASDALRPRRSARDW